jgi:thymidine phosphorylase
MKICGIKNAKNKSEEILSSGEAYEKFVQILNEQNGKKDLEEKISQLKLGKYKKVIKAKNPER